ncbi:MAG TPA: non-heme iron oxygenase ferredoxin subunit [Acidobacteriota bacterium]|nr:non-heme iron oxygenase ferredoxin subunit [Acidobacteriota bacterium]
MMGTATPKWIEVAASDSIADGEARTFAVDGRRIAVARAEGELFAVQDLCTHDDGPLGEGRLQGHAIQCPRHGAQFDVRTGEVLSMPAVVPIATFPVQEQDGKVLVGMPEVTNTTADSGDDW